MTNQPNKIIVHLGSRGWLGTYTGPHSKEIGELFDTCTLCLPFTSRAPLETVMADLRARKPGVVVEHFGSR